MKIQSMPLTDERVLSLFSLHDDAMIAFLAEDSRYYTRYTDAEQIEAVWIAFSGDVPAGCIAYRTKEDGVGEVKRLFVRPEYRGRGLSRELLKTLEHHAKAQGCRTLYLDTRITLEPAVSLYRASGFRITRQQGLYIQMENRFDHRKTGPRRKLPQAGFFISSVPQKAPGIPARSPARHCRNRPCTRDPGYRRVGRCGPIAA
ncbi:MAG: GNAT family N-acetyltransferase [Ruminococcaceae bacterium]|nr:GNAT family N-acetyltransferase [Oscillospiraceae bacterium]